MQWLECDIYRGIISTKTGDCVAAIISSGALHSITEWYLKLLLQRDTCTNLNLLGPFIPPPRIRVEAPSDWRTKCNAVSDWVDRIKLRINRLHFVSFRCCTWERHAITSANLRRMRQYGIQCTSIMGSYLHGDYRIWGDQSQTQVKRPTARQYIYTYAYIMWPKHYDSYHQTQYRTMQSI